MSHSIPFMLTDSGSTRGKRPKLSEKVMTKTLSIISNKKKIIHCMQLCISLPYIVGTCVYHYHVLLEMCISLPYTVGKCVFHYHVLLANVLCSLSFYSDET